MELGPRIKSLLREKGIVISDLGKRLGKSRQSMNSLLNSKNFHARTLINIMNAAKLSPWEVLGPFIEWGPVPSSVGEPEAPYHVSGNIPMIGTGEHRDFPKHSKDERWMLRRPFMRLPSSLWQGEHVAFQMIEANMSPSVNPFGWVISEKIEVEQMEIGQAYVCVLSNGLATGRAKSIEESQITLQPDNDAYAGKVIQIDEILEVYVAKGVFEFPFPMPTK